MVRDKAEKQKQKAKEMLGITDDRADEIFQEEPDRMQQQKEEIQKKKQKAKQKKQPENNSQPQPETQEEEEETEESEKTACPECGREFDSERGMKVHKGQMH